MNIVIQCAATKHPDAGRFKTLKGKEVHFVAAPEFCSESAKVLYTRPDDVSDMPNLTWRGRLEKYIAEERRENPFNLSEAYRLYKHAAYAGLVDKFGVRQVFILSAGWGLVRADYLLPAYNVTFSRRAKDTNPAAFCGSTDGYQFFQQLPKSDKGPIVFLGGKDYLALFDSLTRSLQRDRTVFVRTAPENPKTTPSLRYSFTQRPFPTASLMKWHYQCAQALCSGKISI